MYQGSHCKVCEDSEDKMNNSKGRKGRKKKKKEGTHSQWAAMSGAWFSAKRTSEGWGWGFLLPFG